LNRLYESENLDVKSILSIQLIAVGFYIAPYATGLFHTAAFPRSRDYFIPVGDGKVLISLAVHLDNEVVRQMAIARVIELVKEGELQTACILSVKHVVIVKVDKRHHPAKIAYTKPLRILEHDEDENLAEGAVSLISTLSAFPRSLAGAPCPQKDPATDRPVIPLEIVERIFTWIASESPSAISNFALACKQFAAIVDDNSIRFPGCTLFPPLGCAESRLFPCAFGVAHRDLQTAVFYVAGEIDGLEHTPCDDYMQASCRGMYDGLGHRWDYDVLIDGSKSGLFGLNLSLCESDEQGSYSIMIRPRPTVFLRLVQPRETADETAES
jgi:hypothetical protein